MLGTREYTLCSPFRANSHNSSYNVIFYGRWGYLQHAPVNSLDAPNSLVRGLWPDAAGLERGCSGLRLQLFPTPYKTTLLLYIEMAIKEFVLEVHVLYMYMYLCRRSNVEMGSIPRYFMDNLDLCIY